MSMDEKTQKEIDLVKENQEKEAALEVKKEELAEGINKCMDGLKELGLEAMIIISQPELHVEGIWCTTENNVIKNGLVRLAEKTI